MMGMFKRSIPHLHTKNGHRVELFSGDTDCFCIEDIAHSLSLAVRWGNKFDGAITVAEHSLVCQRVGQALGFSTELQMHLLLHDAAEAYLFDAPATYKAAIWFQSPAGEMVSMDELESRILGRIYRSFGILEPSFADASVVTAIDHAIRCLEWEQITSNPLYTIPNEDCQAYMDWLQDQGYVANFLREMYQRTIYGMTVREKAVHWIRAPYDSVNCDLDAKTEFILTYLKLRN